MFVWELPDGNKAEFKTFSELPLKAFRKIREENLDDMGALFALIDVGCSPETAAMLDEQPIGALDGIVEAWSSASEAGLGES